MNHADYIRHNYDNWKTNQPYEPPYIEILIVDIREVPERFLVVDEDAVTKAYKSGQTSIPGLDICEIF